VPDLILEEIGAQGIQYKFISCNETTEPMIEYFKEFLPSLREIRLGTSTDASLLAKQLMPTLLKSLTDSLQKKQ